MAGKIRNLYAGGNTAVGFYSLYPSVLQGLERLFILKGGPGTGKSSLMKDIAEQLIERNYDVELLHCSSDNSSLDGVLIPSLQIGIVDGTAPHIMDPIYPGVHDEIVYLGDCWDRTILFQNKKSIKLLTDQISKSFEQAYHHFAEAKAIHLEREDIYLKGMNFEKANLVTNHLLEELFSSPALQHEREKQPVDRHMFFGAATPKGVVNFIDNLTEGLTKRIIVKGRPGSGKSTMLKKIVAQSLERGFDTEIFHCGFDPNSLDMVIIPELGIAVLDGTAPHEIVPTREGDTILDMYEQCFDQDIDSEYATDLSEIADRYKEQTALGVEHLALAKQLHDELEKFYIEAMDFQLVNLKKEYIQNEIYRMID